MQVIIRHRDGREYGIESEHFRHGKHVLNPKTGEMESFADAGFRIVSLADGSPYTGPLNDPPSERKAEG